MSTADKILSQLDGVLGQTKWLSPPSDMMLPRACRLTGVASNVEIELNGCQRLSRIFKEFPCCQSDVDGEL